MYTYIHTYKHIHNYIDTYTCKCTYIHDREIFAEKQLLSMFACLYACVSVYIYIFTHQIYTYAHTCICAFMCMCARYAQVDITHANTRTYTNLNP